MPPASPPQAEPRRAGRGFWLAAAALVAVALLLRLAMLDEHWTSHPIAHEPWSDGQIYWEDAGRIAAGEFHPPTPFLSAPLYPYFAACIRAAGGDLWTLYVVQLGLHLVTALLIAHIAGRWYGPAAGLVALSVFLALSEPAQSVLRVLGNTVQLLIVTLLAWRWTALADGQLLSRSAGFNAFAVGLLIGLLALTYPAAMLLVPVFAAWVWWRGGGRLPAGLRAVGSIAAAGVLIALPTIHNYRASGDLIVISAHGGITLRQGNGPISRGVFTYVADIDPDRRRMHESAAAVFVRKHGRPGSWAEIDAHFRHEVTRFWAEQPLTALILFGRKLFWFASSVNYDDLTPLPLEREAGLGLRSWLAPLPSAWILGAAAAGLIALIRTRRSFAPALFLLVLPLVTVLVFFYTPRYRLPAVPIACVLTGYAASRAARQRVPLPVAGLIVATPAVLTMVSVALDYDTVGRLRSAYRASLLPALVDFGDARLRHADQASARAAYERALRLQPRYGRAQRRLGVLHAQSGADESAERAFRVALVINPADPHAHRHLYNLLIRQERYTDAVDTLRRLIDTEPETPEPTLYLAWLLATCPDERLRQPAEALRLAEAACGLPNPDNAASALEVLAAAYAACARFEEAAAAANEAALRWRAAGDSVRGAIRALVSGRAYARGVVQPAAPLSFDGY